MKNFRYYLGLTFLFVFFVSNILAQEVQPKKYSLKTISIGYGYNTQLSVNFDHLFLKNKRIQIGYQVGIGKRFFKYPDSYFPNFSYSYGLADGWTIPITAYILFGKASNRHHFGLGFNITSVNIDNSFKYIDNNNPSYSYEYKQQGINCELSLPLMYRYLSPSGGFYLQLKGFLPVYSIGINHKIGDSNYYNNYNYASNTDNPFRYLELQVGWTFKNKNK